MILKLYSDGGARGNPGPAGCGFVVYDQECKPVLQGKKYIGETTNNQAEYKAMILGVHAILGKFKPTDLECYADSELLIKQLKGEYKVKNKELQPLHKKLKDFFKQIPEVRLFHIPREKNQAADKLANEAMDTGL